MIKPFGLLSNKQYNAVVILSIVREMLSANKPELFKYNRNDTSSEDAGEVVASKIMQMCGLKTVDYHFATLTKENGEKVKADEVLIAVPPM